MKKDKREGESCSRRGECAEGLTCLGHYLHPYNPSLKDAKCMRLHREAAKKGNIIMQCINEDTKNL